MPVIFNSSGADFELVLWYTTETEEELESLVDSSDVISSQRFSNPGRRMEHLAARAALRTIVPHGEVFYDNVGAPYILENEKHRNISERFSLGTNQNSYDTSLHKNEEALPKYISLSHAGSYAAAMLSYGKRCSVDIENVDRDFSKTLSRFVSPQEHTLTFSADPRFAAAMWCAKECAYKCCRTKGLDFLRDIKVLNLDGKEAKVEVSGAREIEMRVLFVGNTVIVHSV